MEDELIKEEIRELWISTFHDSKEYVSLIFDNFYDNAIKVYKTDNEKVIGSIIGIPYSFSLGNTTFKGLYLCGIATDYHHRRKGIMTELLKEIEQKAAKDYDFLFLIPSDENKRRLYFERGFYTGIYRVYEYYTCNHNFDNDFQSSLFYLDDRVKELKINLFNTLTVKRLDVNNEEEIKNIIEYIKDKEKELKNILNIKHTEKDIRCAIIDNNIYHGDIIYSTNSSGDINSLLFSIPGSDGRIKIYSIYSNEFCSYYKILNHLKNKYAEMPFTVIRRPDEVTDSALWRPESILPNPQNENLESLVGVELRSYSLADHSTRYASIKFLNYDCIFEALSKINSSISFTVAVKLNNGKSILAKIKNGAYNVIPLDVNNQNIQKEKITILNERDFFNIILRKKTKDDIVMEAFGIPRLPLHISLMLD